MIKYVLDQVGSDFFLGIYAGNKNDIEVAYNRAYNFEVTNGQLHWLHEDTRIGGVLLSFAYFSTTPDAMERGFQFIYEGLLAREAGLFDVTPEITREAKIMVTDFLKSLPRESFVKHLRACCA